MQQFGPQFINYHLMPLLEQMLTDTVQRKKDYLDKLFINGVLEDQEKKNMMDYYFNPARKNEGVPFVGEQEKKDRENLLKHFVDYVRSRGAKPEDRIRAFLPVINEKSEGAVKAVVWPAEVKRNLFLMSYHIAENFEQDQLKELILAKEAAGKTDEAKKDRELLDKGMLMLVKDPATGEFTKYIRATELKAGETAVQFLPAPPAEMVALMQPGFSVPSQQNIQSIAQGGTSPQAVAGANTFAAKPADAIPDQASSNDELTKSFQQKRGKAIVNQLQKQGFEVQGDVQFDANGHALVKVKSGSDNLLVSVDTRLPFDQDLKFTITFQNGPAGGKSFTVDESKMDEAFHKPDGSTRSARELYNDADLSKKLGVKSDAYPQKAPGAPQPVPKVGLPGKPQEPGIKEPFKIPAGAQPMPQPFEEKGGEEVTEVKFVLPKDHKAAPMPKGPKGEEEKGKEGVGTEIKVKPVPGIPAGSVMAAKAKLKQQQEEEEEKKKAMALAGAPPVAPGRVGQQPVVAAAPKPKSNFGRNVVLAHLGIGVPTFGGAGAVMGIIDEGSPVNVAWKTIKGVWVAVSHYLPHFFG